MIRSKRKIKAKPFVRDLRQGMDDRGLMEKYVLSESQLHKVLHKLVDAGEIDEMELFMRTYLSDSTMTKAFVDSPNPVPGMGGTKEAAQDRDLETPSDVSITEKVTTTSGVFRRMLGKIGRTG